MDYGAPVGNIRLGRRFTPEELKEIASGVSPEDIVERCAPPPRRVLSQEEMYEQLFGGDE